VGVLLHALTDCPCPLAGAGARVGVVQHQIRAVQPELQQRVQRGRNRVQRNLAHRARRRVTRDQSTPAPRLRERVDKRTLPFAARIRHPRNISAMLREHRECGHGLAAEQLRYLARGRPQFSRGAVVVRQEREAIDHLGIARKLARMQAREIVRVVNAKQHAARRVGLTQPS
jgi:hypothetical protein